MSNNFSPQDKNYIEGIETLYNFIRTRVYTLKERSIPFNKNSSEIMTFRRIILQTINNRQNEIKKLKTQKNLKIAIEKEEMLLRQVEVNFIIYFQEEISDNSVLDSFLYPLFEKDFNENHSFMEIVRSI